MKAIRGRRDILAEIEREYRQIVKLCSLNSSLLSFEHHVRQRNLLLFKYQKDYE
jgi:hypothetical protein